MPKLVQLPAECGELQKIDVEGASAIEVMERQKAAILAYKAQIKACFRR